MIEGRTFKMLGPMIYSLATACGDGNPYPESLRKICDGTDGFTFQRVNSNTEENHPIYGVAWRNGMGYLRVDGHCQFYAYNAERNDPIVSGFLSAKEANVLAIESRYDSWPELNGLQGTGTWADAPVQILNDGVNELSCRNGCRNDPVTFIEGEVEIAAILKPMLDASDRWRDRLLARGAPARGNVRFAALLQEKIIYAGQFQKWPLATPIEQYAVDPRLLTEMEAYAPASTGYLAEGAEAVALRELRAVAAASSTKRSGTESWIAIDGPDDRFYSVVVADVLPYEDENGVVPRRREAR